MKWLCKKGFHKWSAWRVCTVVDEQNIFSDRADYRECSRCKKIQILPYYRVNQEVDLLLKQARESFSNISK